MNRSPATVAPVLVFAWGNPSRGDDALGPRFAEQLAGRLAEHPAARPGADAVECLTDFQLQVEHALDLAGRQRVLFVDASASCAEPFEVRRVRPDPSSSFTTHALEPEAVLHVYRQLHGCDPPPCTLLAIRGEGFGLGEPPSAAALAHLDQALAWALRWLDAPMLVVRPVDRGARRTRARRVAATTRSA